MKKLLCYLKGFGLRSVLAPLLKLCEVVLELLVPYIVASVVDGGGIDAGFVWTRFAQLIVCGLCGLAFAVVAQYFSASVASSFTARVKDALFDTLVRLPLTEWEKLGQGTPMTLLTADCDQLQTGTNLFLRLFLRSPFVVFGSLIASFLIDTRLAVVYAVMIPIVGILAYFILTFGIRYIKKTRSALGEMTKETKEAVAGGKLYRAMNEQSTAEKSFSDKSLIHAKELMKSSSWAAVLDPLAFALVNLAVVVLLRFAGVRVERGELSQGQTVALYNYGALILAEIVKFANLTITVSGAVASAQRIGDVLSIQQPPKRSPIQSNGSFLQMNHMFFRYENANGYALEDISFSIKKGEKIGVIGGSGSGKTTLLDVVAGLYPVTEGQLFLIGKSIESYDEAKLRSLVAYALQKAELFPGTVRENILFGSSAEALKPGVLRASESAEIVEKKGGIDAVLSYGATDCSGGQRQRLSLARTLNRDAEIYLLDDCTSALDTKTAESVTDALFAKDGKTVIFASQRISSVYKADKVLVLDKGKAVGFAPHSELLSSCPVYREIYRSQYGEEA